LLRVNKMVTVDLTDVMEDATLLFADIAGFTKFSSSVEPEEVVKMLSELFTEFDQMCVKLKVYKVYTIGDAYVALGFLNAAERNPPVEANNIIKMGIGMIDIIKRVKKQLNHPGLNMRIGVHTVS
jgi:Adenylate cyclase, family 3 (some proteins contain HAMP domain)